VLALVARVLGFVLTRGEGEALALKFRQGRDYRYHLEMTLQGTLSSSQSGPAEPFSETIDIKFAMHVLSVDQQGTATIDLEQEEGEVSVNGEHQTSPNDFRSRIRITKDGKFIADDGGLSAVGGASGLSVPGFDQFTPLLPDHAVYTGDAWSKDFDRPFPLGEGVIHYATRNRLDPSGGQQVKSTTKGDVDLRLLFAGFPAQEEAPEGELRMLGTIELSLQRVS